GGYVHGAGDDPESVELKPGHHIGREFHESGKAKQIIANNKAKHPDARIIEVAYAGLDHALRIVAYDGGEEDVKLSFDVDRQAVDVMDEEETQIAPYDRQFASKSTGKRAMQLFAGPMMNFVLAIVIFFILGLIQGVPMKEAIIDKVEPGTPAAEAGFKHGDEVI